MAMALPARSHNRVIQSGAVDSLGPVAMRELLVATGLPQGIGGHIGPLPNLPSAMAQTLGLFAVDIDVNS